MRRMFGLQLLAFLLCAVPGKMGAQTWDENLQVHGYATQGFLFSSKNNYLSMKSSEGSLQWTDGAISVTDAVTDRLRVGIQLHMYQLGQFGGPNVQVDWVSGDYRFDDRIGIRAGKIKTVLGLFNDSQDVEPVFLWILLPQTMYPIENRSFMLSEIGGEVYGELNLGEGHGRLKYRAHAGEAYLDPNQGYAQQYSQFGLNFSNPPQGLNRGGDLRWVTPVRGWTLGASVLIEAMDGTSPQGALRLPDFLVPAFYSQFNRGKWFFAGEYWRAPVHSILTFGATSIPWVVDQRSWYVMASYRFSEKVQVGSYYSHYVNKAANTGVPENYSKDWVLSGRYNFNSYFYGKLEAHFLHGTGLGYYANTNPDGLQPNSRMLAAKVGFTF